MVVLQSMVGYALKKMNPPFPLNLDTVLLTLYTYAMHSYLAHGPPVNQTGQLSLASPLMEPDYSQLVSLIATC